jgi:hypothetical protein
MGFGVTKTSSINELMANELRNVRILTYNMQNCKDVYWQARKSAESQICAGDLMGGRDSCFGDSGGPLFVIDRVNDKQKFVDVGLVYIIYVICIVANYAKKNKESRRRLKNLIVLWTILNITD